MGVSDYLNLSHLAVVGSDEAHELRPVKQKGAEPSRSQVNAEKRSTDAKDEKKCKTLVWARDGGCCRWCKRKVQRIMDLLPERAEFHHVNGRVVLAIRWDPRNLAVFCRACHEKLTGIVNEKFLIHSKHLFVVDAVSYIDASKPFRYQRVA